MNYIISKESLQMEANFKLCRKKLHSFNSNLKTCPICVSIRKKRYHKENILIIKEKKANYYQKNKEIIKENRKIYYLNNKQSCLSKYKEYRKTNPQAIQKYESSDKRKNQLKRYYQENKQKINTYKRKKRKNDIQFHISTNLRARLRSALKNNYRAGSAVKDLGCSIKELKLHLEKQFKDGMTWENYGSGKHKWSIDHIIALSTVDLTNKENFIKVNNYTNLRPLWNKDQSMVYHKEQKKK